MVGCDDIQSAIGDCRYQCSLVCRAFNRRVTLDQVAELCVLRIVKMQEMNTGLCRDAFAVDGAWFEQVQFAGSGYVQYMQL